MAGHVPTHRLPSLEDVCARSRPKTPRGYGGVHTARVTLTEPRIFASLNRFHKTITKKKSHALTVKLEEEFPPKPSYVSDYATSHPRSTHKMDELLSSKL